MLENPKGIALYCEPIDNVASARHQKSKCQQKGRNLID